MAKKAGATHKIISNDVGEGKTNNKTDVARIQALLNRIGYGLTEDGGWGKNTRGALQHFQAHWTQGAAVQILAPELQQFKDGKQTVNFGPGGLPVQSYVTTGDTCLFALAHAAGMLLELSKKTGFAAFNEVWPRLAGLPYRGYDGNGAAHMFWGLDLDGYEHYAIMTGDSTHRDKGGGKGYQFLPKHEPLGLHCTSFATLIMAVWHQGNLRKEPYDAYLGWGGDRPHLAKDYCFDLCAIANGDKSKKMLESGDDLRQAVSEPSRFYLIEVASQSVKVYDNKDSYHYASWGVSHYVASYNGNAYEASSVEKELVCQELKARGDAIAARGKKFYVWGPSPSL